MKAQASFEYYFSLVLFVMFATYIVFQTISVTSVYRREIRNRLLKTEAYQISELLVNDLGEPINWAQTSSWLTGWRYRRAITIDNTANPNTLTNYQVLVNLDTASLISQGKMNQSCSDIRFTDSDGSLISYWTESGCNSANTKIWVKVPSIPASATKVIYLFYGNPSATRADNPQNLDLWQLREHQTSTSYYPAITFSKPTGSVIRIDSYTAGTSSLGQGYVFIVIPKNYLNGKKVQVYWNVYFSYSDSRDLGLAKVLVLDTELNRKQSLSIGSIENLFTNVEATHYPGPLGAPTGWLSWRTDTSNILDLSTFTSDYVTLMIRLADAWTGQTVMVDVDWLKILDTSNNVLLTFDFPDNVTMEVSNTYEDYGLYRKYTSPEPTTSIGGEESPSTVEIRRIGLSSELKNATNLISIIKLQTFNQTCSSDYNFVAEKLGVPQDYQFEINITNLTSSTILASCLPPTRISRENIAEVTRIAALDSGSYVKITVRVW